MRYGLALAFGGGGEKLTSMGCCLLVTDVCQQPQASTCGCSEGHRGTCSSSSTGPGAGMRRQARAGPNGFPRRSKEQVRQEELSDAEEVVSARDFVTVITK